MNKKELVDYLKGAGAFDVGVVNPSQIADHAIHDRHPLKYWTECRSVIVFVIAKSTQAKDLRALLASAFMDDTPSQIRVAPLYHFFSNIIQTAQTFLTERGFQGRENHEIQLKLAAFEAGLGVYGRCGFILHPMLGARLFIGSILTDAEIEPDRRLNGYVPCDGCSLCVDNCPAEAFDSNKEYPNSFSIDSCRALYDGNGTIPRCSLCWQNCPAGKLDEKTLFPVGK